MNIFITGAKTWSNGESVRAYISRFNPSTDIIVHELEGTLDAMSKALAEEMGFKTKVGNLADADYVIVFHPFIRNSKRSKQILDEAKEKHIPYLLISA